MLIACWVRGRFHGVGQMGSSSGWSAHGRGLSSALGGASSSGKKIVSSRPPGTLRMFAGHFRVMVLGALRSMVHVVACGAPSLHLMHWCVIVLIVPE